MIRAVDWATDKADERERKGGDQKVRGQKKGC